MDVHVSETAVVSVLRHIQSPSQAVRDQAIMDLAWHILAGITNSSVATARQQWHWDGQRTWDIHRSQWRIGFEQNMVRTVLATFAAARQLEYQNVELPHPPPVGEVVDVTMNGTVMQRGADYTFAGGVVHFRQTPTRDSAIVISTDTDFFTHRGDGITVNFPLEHAAAMNGQGNYEAYTLPTAMTIEKDKDILFLTEAYDEGLRQLMPESKDGIEARDVERFFESFLSNAVEVIKIDRKFNTLSWKIYWRLRKPEPVKPREKVKLKTPEPRAERHQILSEDISYD